MNNSQKIFVIEEHATNKIKIKGSQFICHAYNIKSASDGQNKLEMIKKEYFDATHHCYAYKIKNGDEKYSDDGEPNGTAGIRIFNAIKHFELTDIIVIVVRYYGGTKLGVGPLGKAYGGTAAGLLKEAKIITKIKYEIILIEYNFDEVNSIHYLLNKYNCKKINNLFNEIPKIECCIEPFHLLNFENELKEKTKGNASFEKKKEIFI